MSKIVAKVLIGGRNNWDEVQSYVWLDTPGVIINTPVHKDNAVSSSAMMHIAQDLIFTDQASTR